MTVQELIESFTSAIESYGYVVMSEAIPGEEETYCQSLKLSLAHIIASQVVIEERYKTRGKSKRFLKILHETFPNPGFGIEPVAK